MKSTTTVPSLSDIVIELRAKGEIAEVSNILKLADERGVSYSLDDVMALIREQRNTERLALPSWLADFLCEWARSSGFESVIDPRAGTGLLIGQLGKVKSIKRITAACRSHEDYLLAEKLFHDSKFTWVNGRLEECLPLTALQGDAVISCPPFGGTRNKETISWRNDNIEVVDDFGRVAVLRTLSNLSEAGRAAIIVTPSFFFQRGEKAIISALPKLGLYLDAAISIPSGSLLPLTNIETYLLFISRKESEKLFVGQLSTNTDRNKGLLANLRNRKESKKDPAMGRLVSASDFSGFNALVSKLEWETYIEENQLTSMPFSSFCVEVNAANKEEPFFENKDNSLYLPILGVAPAVTSPNNLALPNFKIKPKNYLQLVLDPSIILADYLALTLNSPRGKQLRQSLCSGSTIPMISKRSLAVGIAAIPPLKVQLGIVETETKIRALQTELSELSSKLHQSPASLDEVVASLTGRFKEDDFENWLASLPFPLASILWVYHAKKTTSEGKARQLLYFFEALSSFYATIFISGIHGDQEMFTAFKEKLSSVLPPDGLREATIGKWIRIVELAVSSIDKISRSGDDEQRAKLCRLFGVTHLETLCDIFTSNVVDVLQDANTRRNEWQGHGGLSGESEWRRRQQYLEGLLLRFRESVGRGWDRYRLIRPGTCEFSDGSFIYQAQILMGDRMIFKSETLDLQEALDSKKLYLVERRGNRGLELLPFVKVLSSPASEENACYFFNRVTSDGVKVVSYHFEQASEQTDEFKDIVNVLNELS
jgi:hypothetical protein